MKGNKIQQAEGKLLSSPERCGLPWPPRRRDTLGCDQKIEGEAEAASRNLQIALLRFCFSTKTLLFVHIVHLI